jgi:hypothetical protein
MGACAGATIIASYGERLEAKSRVLGGGSDLILGMLVKKWTT